MYHVCLWKNGFQLYKNSLITTQNDETILFTIGVDAENPVSVSKKSLSQQC